ncbi:MAG: helix-turn-helix domain-containing protein, partial [Pseudomonadota bacterium]
MSCDETISPAERRRLRVRQAILDAAERVFAEDGEAGLSIRRLADEIDYSPGAIYKYFQSKQELVDELKESFFARILEQVEDVPDDTGPFLDYSRRCIETYIRTALER